MRRMFLFACLLAAVPPTAAPARAVATAGQVGLNYAIYVGGLHLFDAALEARLDDDGRYALSLAGGSRGMADWMASFRGRSESSGAFGPEGVRPDRYQSDRTFRGEERSVTLDYDGAAVADTVEPASGRGDREPVPDGLKPGTVDPLSAGLSALLATSRAGKCQAAVSIFDGLSRYDLLAADGGAAPLPRSRYGIYEGPALRCSVEHRMLAGFWRDRSRPRERRPIDLWLAPIGPGGLQVPVRAEGESWFGSVVIHLIGATGLQTP